MHHATVQVSDGSLRCCGCVGSSNEVGSGSNGCCLRLNIRQGDRISSPSPSQLTWETLVAYVPKEKKRSVDAVSLGKSNQRCLRKWIAGLTEKVFDQSPVDCRCRTVTKGDDGSQQLAEREILGRRSERVRRVEGLGGDLAPDLGHGETVGINDLVGPVVNCFLENGLVEDVVVSKVEILAADTRIVLEDIMDIELVQREVSGIGLRVDENRLLPHERRQIRIEVEAVAQTSHDVVFRQVTAVCLIPV